MVLSRLKEEVEELEEDLKLQTQMNGISLNSCIIKTLRSSKNAKGILFFPSYVNHIVSIMTNIITAVC